MFKIIVIILDDELIDEFFSFDIKFIVYFLNSNLFLYERIFERVCVELFIIFMVIIFNILWVMMVIIYYILVNLDIKEKFCFELVDFFGFDMDLKQEMLVWIKFNKVEYFKVCVKEGFW